VVEVISDPMPLIHTPEPIVDPERLFNAFENLMPFRVRKPPLTTWKKVSAVSS